MLCRKAVRQQRIANGARKWNVHCSAQVKMSDLGVFETELPPAEAMWMNRYMRPCRYLLFELPHLCHCRSNSLLHSFDERTAWLDSGQQCRINTAARPSIYSTKRIAAFP